MKKIENNFEYTVENEKASITKYDGSDESVIIPNTLGGYEVTSIGEWAFMTCADLTDITLGDSITSIGKCAFAGCNSLTSIEIPDSVTSIGDTAFLNCTSLPSIKIGNSVTSIGECAFSCCSSLTSIEISNSVTSLGALPFSFCDSLAEFILSENHPVYSFLDGILFDKTKQLLHTYFNLGDDGVYKIPNFVTSIGKGAFFCSSLRSIEIPQSVTTIEDAAFCNCFNLTMIEIPDSVISIGKAAFSYSDSLTEIKLSKNHSVYSFVDRILFDKTKKMLHSYLNVEVDFDSDELDNFYEIPDFITSIGKGAFTNANLITLKIPDSVTSIGDEAFFCSHLMSLGIPDSVTHIGDKAFSACEELTSVEIPDSVISIGTGAFWDSDSVSLTLGKNSYAHKYAIENDIDFVLVHPFLAS